MSAEETSSHIRSDSARANGRQPPQPILSQRHDSRLRAFRLSNVVPLAAFGAIPSTPIEPEGLIVPPVSDDPVGDPVSGAATMSAKLCDSSKA